MDDPTKVACEKAINDLLDDQTLCRDLMRYITEPMRIPALKDRIKKNSQSTSKVLNDGKLVEKANLDDSKKTAQLAKLTQFDKPLDATNFGIKNAEAKAKKTYVFTFFGESGDTFELSAASAKLAREA